KAAFEAIRYRPQVVEVQVPTKSGNGQAEGGKSTAFFGEQEDVQLSGVHPRWTFAVEDEIRSSPVLLGNTVYVGSYDTNIWSINAEDGKMLWKQATEG